MDDQKQNPQNIIRPDSLQNTEQPVVSQDSQQVPQSHYPPIFSINPSNENGGSENKDASNPQDNHGFLKAVGRFTFGGTKNVDRVDRFTRAAIISQVIYIATLALLAGMSYLHFKFGDTWLKIPFITFTVLGLLSMIYFGWIRRELLWGRGLMWNVVRHGTAVGVSILYIASILLFSGVGWNWPHSSNTSTSTQSSQSTQSPAK